MLRVAGGFLLRTCCGAAAGARALRCLRPAGDPPAAGHPLCAKRAGGADDGPEASKARFCPFVSGSRERGTSGDERWTLRTWGSCGEPGGVATIMVLKPIAAFGRGG